MTIIPYPFQQRVAELLLSGRNVILQAPTGAGKTTAALLPLQRARQRGLHFPRRCIYAVPMRVLANQFASDYADVAPCIRIQTGEHPDDPRFEADVTFATIDQVLSSFLLSPYSLSRGQANMNLGAIAASYLVFDEFHLFDPQSMLPTTLEMLRILRGVAPFLLMTATFSGEMLAGLARALDAVVVPEDDDARKAIAALPSLRKLRRYHLVDGPLTAEAVLNAHRRRTLVVCNQVGRAQAMYRALRDHPQRGDTRVILLHARFLPDDRGRIESTLRTVFGKENRDPGRWIAVATQAIEVGLDITCEALHTELAPANAIVQRAGRCARYRDEEGDVYVYTHAVGDDEELLDLVENCLPYRDLRAECGATVDALRDVSGKVLSFAEEQDVVSRVHGPRDRRTVEGLAGGREAHRDLMNAVLRGDYGASAGQLIRQVSTQRVVIHPNPKEMGDNPYAWESFGLHAGTVRRLVKGWLERAQELALDDVGVHALHDCGDPDESGRTEYAWLPITSVDDAIGAVMLAVSPALAGYSSEMGFLPDCGGQYVAHELPRAGAKEWVVYRYHLEPFEEHARLVLEAARAAWEDLDYAAKRLELRAGWPEGTLRRAAELVALLHDAGKLSEGWQGWVRRYQRAIGRPVSRGFYAHTDRDPTIPQYAEAERAMGFRPPHAMESALSVTPLLASLLYDRDPDGDVTKAALTAIGRHHGAFARTFRSYRLAQGAETAIANLLAGITSQTAWEGSLLSAVDDTDPQIDLSEILVDPQCDNALLAYGLLARCLRRADQAGTAAAGIGSREEEGM
ncbi:MAG TPA: CRISPR-associated helicase Cas3' [Chloroflexi bacterium]|nr:CRISPR-associated helicase Cas3' [Chloroflexota bacterium]